MISRVVPKLPYIDKQQTIKFYVKQLGFKLQSDYEDYIIIAFPNAELHFFAYPDIDPRKSDFMIYLRVNSKIEEMYHMFQKDGVVIHPNGKLENKAWRQREFSIIDPNGTLLTLGKLLIKLTLQSKMAKSFLRC